MPYVHDVSFAYMCYVILCLPYTIVVSRARLGITYSEAVVDAL